MQLILVLLLGLGITGHDARAAGWRLSEFIVDQEPLANDRANDLAIGDLNGDGRPDIWLSGRNGADHQAAWYANPDARDEPWQRFTFLEGSWKYGALGDLDGDGDLDIVAGFDDEKKVYWCENDGSPEDGGWAKHFIGLTGAPDQIFAHDLDADGRLEVIVVYKGGPVRILHRPADPRQPWPEASLAEAAAGAAGASIGDVDGDGDPDIVLGNAWYENPLPSADWTAGGWTGWPVDEAWPKEARSVVADIDGDGTNDVVLSGEESDAGVAWYSNPEPRSGRSWQKTVVSDDYAKVHSLAVADFNSDGRPDILAAEMHTSPNRRVTVFEQGARPDQWFEHIVATVGTHNAKVADLDGDGMPDIAGKNFENDKRPRVWFNRRGPDPLALERWRREVVATGLPHQASFIRTGDLNGDGMPDLATGAWWWANPGRIDARWQRQPIGQDLQNVAVLHDLDRDGDLDVVGTDGTPVGDRFFWAENDGSGAFSVHPAATADGDFLQGAAVGHLLGDGALQIVLSWHNGQRTDPPKGTQWLEVPEDPNQPWAWAKIQEFSSEEEIAIADFDGDGDLDIHAGSAWLRNERDGRFSLRSAVVLAEGDVDRVRLADIDGDGDLDVVIGAEHAERLVWGEHPGGDDARGQWREHVIATDFRHMSVDVADLDGDGDQDVVSGEHQGDGRVTIYENGGKGAAWIRQTVDPGTRAPSFISQALEAIGLAAPEPIIDHHAGSQLVDLDQDGDLDIVSIGWDPVSLVIYENLAVRKGEARSTHAYDTIR